MKSKKKIKAWAIYTKKGLYFYDGMPCIYRSKRRCDDETNFSDTQITKKIELTVEEL